MKATSRTATPSDGHAIIRALLFSCARVLDLGCGERHHTKDLPNTVWIDIDPGHARDSRVLVLDVTEAPGALRRMRFDAALLTDVIEHLPKAAGMKLLAELEAIADRIIVFTPLGGLWVEEANTSPHAHRSGWAPSDFPSYHHWTWSQFHRFQDGHTHGAFFAWKWLNGATPSPEEIAQLSGLSDL